VRAKAAAFHPSSIVFILRDSLCRLVHLKGLVQHPDGKLGVLASITMEILISEVLIIMILIPSFAMAENILAATPSGSACPRRRSRSWNVFLHGYALAPISATTFFMSVEIFLESVFGTVRTCRKPALADVLDDHVNTDVIGGYFIEDRRRHAGFVRTPVIVTFTWFLSTHADTTLFPYQNPPLSRGYRIVVKTREYRIGTLYFLRIDDRV